MLEVKHVVLEVYHTQRTFKICCMYITFDNRNGSNNKQILLPRSYKSDSGHLNLIHFYIITPLAKLSYQVGQIMV